MLKSSLLRKMPRHNGPFEEVAEEEDVEKQSFEEAAEKQAFDEDAEAECWICREPSSADAPLVRPCACRGSMSGVHAACVEEWIQHHRQTGQGQEPLCSVCRHPYVGRNETPGFGSFLRALTVKAVPELRRLLLMSSLIVYPTAAVSLSQGDRKVFDVIVVIMSFVLTVHKAVVLTASLGSVPKARALHFFRIVDQEQLQREYLKDVTSEIGALLMSSYYKGMSSLPFLMPLLAVGAFPLAKVMSANLKSTVMNIFCSVISALVGVGIVFLLKDWMLVFYQIIGLFIAVIAHWDFLDAGPHLVLLAVNTCLGPMGGIFKSNVPNLLVIVVHAALLVGNLNAVILQGQRVHCEGYGWPLVLVHTFLCWSHTILPMTVGAKNNVADIGPTFNFVSGVWVSLMALMIARAFWDKFADTFHNWKHRNRAFRLQVTDLRQDFASLV